jgi:hypothetical protein
VFLGTVPIFVSTKMGLSSLGRSIKKMLMESPYPAGMYASLLHTFFVNRKADKRAIYGPYPP